MRYGVLICLLLSIVFTSCKKDDEYIATPMPLSIPQLFAEKLSPPIIPGDNPQTREGIALGRKLFYDPILSGDGTQACASCHNPQNAFSDERRFSIGIDGLEGNRNSMPLFNMAWNFSEDFFWDGRAKGLENQALEPVTNPIEMHNTWEQATVSLQATSDYPLLFSNAFGTENISKELVVKAISQFTRTLISSNSKFDKHLAGEAELTTSEANGLAVFLDESRGDCFHCHGDPNTPIWTDNTFHNNGLDETITDRGLGAFTGDPRDFGLFKSPSLRNLAFTAPYMHDGRFQTLDEVINHYSEGLVYSETIDPLMKTISEGGVHLSENDKADLKAFLLSLSDPSFINNPDFQDPN
ncbi:cytochrome-c peroxidase [Ulvibacter antarcticus]|uniref:Cytochrome c peroxidase n=1 Tax=Ulvibacter antarcticus TaxID=442714 RepID=A0A3L9YZ21_9FLAO|nr:cytochrome c peroxidase [Ulvibacter antarcticus]RMA65823.1 cytochrome c peroxidase [Ulvibacter antarcticus]